LNWRRWAVLVSMVGSALAGGCGSNTPPFNATPAISNLFPSNIVAGSPGFTLSVVGTGFVATSSKGASFVYWNGFSRSTTLNQTTGELDVQIFASDVALPGTVNVTVINPAPGGGESTALGFTIESLEPGAPVVSSLSPASAKAGGDALTLTVNGNNFAANDAVTWNGAVLSTTFVNSTQVTASVPANDIASAGSASVAVFTPNLVVGSQSVAFPITGPNNLKPTASSLRPSSVAAGSGDTEVLVSGSGFTPLSTANWTVGATVTPLAVAYLSSSQVIVLVSADDIAQAVAAMAKASIDISNPAPGGGTSGALSFTVSGS
jgi:IPT/TIG domain